METPRVVGIAAVIPGPVPKVAEQGQGGGDNSCRGGRGNAELRWSMSAIMVANPVDVSKTGVGYDVRSEGDRQARCATSR